MDPYRSKAAVRTLVAGRPAPAGLKALALASVCLPPALLAWRLLHWPGWALTDESLTLQMWALWHRGIGPAWLAGRGNLHHAYVAGLLALGGWRFGAVRLAPLPLYGAYLVLLWRLGRELFGEAAAWAAVLVSTASALAAVHLGSLLSPQDQPLLWTALALGALRVKGRGWAFAWGLGLGLGFLDYEGWLLVWPGLVAMLAAGPAPRRLLGPAAAGFALASGGVLLWSAPALGDWWAQRRLNSTQGLSTHGLGMLGRHLAEFFVGNGTALPTQGVPHAGQFPLWALPLLAAALLRAWRAPCPSLRWALGISAAVPFAAFALYAPAVPSERVLAAWPALSLLCGEAYAGLAGRSRAWGVGLGLLAVLGGGLEARHFVAGMRTDGDEFYGEGGALLRMGQDLRGLKPLELLAELDAEPRGDLELAAGFPEGRPGTCPAFAVVPWQIRPALAGMKGRWFRYDSGPGQPPQWLYQVPPAELPFWRQADHALDAFWALSMDRTYRGIHSQLLELTAGPVTNSVLRDALWEARFVYGRRCGESDPAEGQRALALKMLRVDPLLRRARELSGSDPRASAALCMEVLKRDPSRWEAWQALHHLDLELGHPRRAAAVLKAWQAVPPSEQVESFWLQE